MVRRPDVVVAIMASPSPRPIAKKCKPFTPIAILSVGVARGLAEMFAQERERALERELRVVRAVATAFVAIEAVAGTGIYVHGTLGRSLLDQLDVGQRDRRVLVTEVIHDRAARLLVEHLRDAAAVVRNRRVDIELARSDVRDGAAPAVTDDGRVAGAARFVHGCFDIGECLWPHE